MTPPDRPLAERLRALAAFLPVFEAPGFEFGRWGGGQRDGQGRIHMPYYEPSDATLRFLGEAGAGGWVRPDIDWVQWATGEEATTFRTSPATVSGATADQLAHLLTMVIRSERFGDGNLEHAYQTGLLTAIMRRAGVLAETAE